jgi:alanine-synthesizing transaminase
VSPVFSRRLPTLTPNRLGLAIEGQRRAGRAFLDLTETNPTRVGLSYPYSLVQALADPGGLAYRPDPRGIPTARETISLDYLRHGLDVDPGRILLTASTSEAYAFLFKLLCDPGDQVLVPAPSYPLFEHLTRLDAVDAVPYPLDGHANWAIDVDAIATRVTPHTRAVLIVSPNNPTGTLLRRLELEALAHLCRDRGLALIGDEVFADYRLPPALETPSPSPRLRGEGRGEGSHAPWSPASVLEQQHCLTFALGGLSKSIGMPQLKLAWTAVTGPSPLVDETMARLELIGDTYLSVSTAVQLALPTLLDEGQAVRARLRDRIAGNLHALGRALERAPGCSLLQPDGGWSAVVRVPAPEPEEVFVLDLLERHGVLVTPGYFYDFPHEAFCIVSLIVQPDVFAAGIERLIEGVL